MGLQNDLSDYSYDSIPLLLLAFLAAVLKHLRSSFSDLLRSVAVAGVDETLFHAVGFGLADLIFLAEQLNLNRDSSHRFGEEIDDAVCGGSDCVICLSNLKAGDRVRRLSCRHVFHKKCFDGWLDHLNFNCPLCRYPLVPDERVSVTRRRVGDDVVDWLSIR